MWFLKKKVLSPPDEKEQEKTEKVLSPLNEEEREALKIANKMPLDSPGNRRIIKTARTVKEINEAARNGFYPLVKPVIPSPDVHQMVAVFQDSETGEIALSGDRRMGYKGKVIDYMTYYPYHFPNPFAAYLIPKDLAIDECVWLEDLIEDLVADWGNQNNHPRLKSAPALWNGQDFEILFDPESDAQHWIG
jgi:hypothetical protein